MLSQGIYIENDILRELNLVRGKTLLSIYFLLTFLFLTLNLSYRNIQFSTRAST